MAQTRKPASLSSNRCVLNASVVVAEAMDPGTWTKEEFTVDTRFDVEETAGVSIWDDPGI